MEEHKSECYVCGDGELNHDDDETMCDNCYFVPSVSEYEPSNTVNAWERFWEQRQKYDGMYGDERRRVVGGFLGAY